MMRYRVMVPSFEGRGVMAGVWCRKRKFVTAMMTDDLRAARDYVNNWRDGWGAHECSIVDMVKEPERYAGLVERTEYTPMEV